jgi:hypothetical protein
LYTSAHTVTAAAAAAAATAATAAAGDGFVLDDAAITAYQLSDAKPFLSALLLCSIHIVLAAAAAAAVAGDGFVLDDTAITAYQLSDPKPFLSALLQRPYFNRVLLAPHLLGPASSGAVLDTPGDLVAKMNSSWGVLAREGFCNGTDCFRLPVIAGEEKH